MDAPAPFGKSLGGGLDEIICGSPASQRGQDLVPLQRKGTAGCIGCCRLCFQAVQCRLLLEGGTGLQWLHPSQPLLVLLSTPLPSCACPWHPPPCNSTGASHSAGSNHVPCIQTLSPPPQHHAALAAHSSSLLSPPSIPYYCLRWAEGRPLEPLGPGGQPPGGDQWQHGPGTHSGRGGGGHWLPHGGATKQPGAHHRRSLVCRWPPKGPHAHTALVISPPPKHLHANQVGKGLPCREVVWHSLGDQAL